MNDFYWINRTNDTYAKRNTFLSQTNPYEVQLTSYEKNEYDDDYISRQERIVRYSDTRDEIIKEEFRQRYESGEYQTEKNRRDLSKLLNYAFPEFSEEYFYENGRSFMKSATGLDVDVDTYWDHIGNVWDSTWKATGTSINLANLYASALFEGGFGSEQFQNDKKIIMDRTRKNGQSYRKQDYEDNYGFLGKAFSKVVEQSPNLVINGALSLASLGASGAAFGIGKALSVSSKTANILKNTIKYGRMATSAVYAGLTEMGSTALEMSKYGFDDDVIFGTSMMQGLFTGLLEGVAEDMVFSGVNNFIDGIFDVAGSNAGKIVDAGFKQALRQFGSSYLKEFAQEPSEEALESISGNLLWNIGVDIMNNRMSQDEIITKSALYNIGSDLQAIEGKNKFDAKYKSLGDFVNDAFESAKEALWSTSLTALGGSSLDIAGSYVFGDARKSVASARFMENNDADIIIKTDPLKKTTKGIVPATEEDIKLQKADPVNVVKVGSMFYPTNVDSRQKYAIDNGKYVFAKESQYSLLDSSEIDETKRPSNTVSPENAEKYLQSMYTSNAFDSYAYVDKNGNIMSDNSSRDASMLVMKNSQGTEYIGIDNKNRDKTNSSATVSNQDNQYKSVNMDTSDNIEKPSEDNAVKNNLSSRFDKMKNSTSNPQSRISSQIDTNTGVNTYSQFKNNINIKRQSLDTGTYYFTDSTGKLLEDEQDAAYIAIKRNGTDSYEIVKIGKNVKPENILSLLKDNNDSVSKKSEDNEKANNEASPVKPSSSSTDIELESDLNDVGNDVNNMDTEDKQKSSGTSEYTAQKKDTKPAEDALDKKVTKNDYSKDADNIPNGEDYEQSKLDSSEIESISSTVSGNTDERQKKTNTVETINGLSDSSIDEIKNEIDSKDAPVPENTETKESYIRKMSSYIMGMDASNTKTNIEILFGKRSDSVDKDSKLLSLLLERISGNSTGSKRRDVLLDKLLSNAKAQWITDRRNIDISDEARNVIDSYFDVDDNTKAENEPAKTKAKRTKKIDEIKENEFNAKNAEKISTAVIYSSFEQNAEGKKYKTSIKESELKDVSTVLIFAKTDLESELTASLAKAISNAKRRYDSVKGKFIDPEYASEIKLKIDNSKSKINSSLNSNDVDIETKKKYIDEYFENELEAAVFNYINTNEDIDLDEFFNKGKDANGNDISTNLFLKNNKFNWNSAERKIDKYINENAANDGPDTVYESQTKATTVNEDDGSFTFGDKMFADNKDKMFIAIPVTVINDKGTPELKTCHFFNHYAVEERLVSLGVDNNDARIASAIMSSFSPEVQEIIYEYSSDELFSKGNLPDNVFGKFTMPDAETGSIVVSSKTDASTIIHEFGHFIWHTNPEIVENISTSLYDSASTEREQLKKYMESREDYFRMLLGDGFDIDDELDFIIDFNEDNVGFENIVNALYDKEPQDIDENLVEDQKHFEELVMAFLECYHADNVQDRIDTFPKKIKDAFTKLAEIFRKALSILKGVEYDSGYSMPDDIADAFAEIYMDDTTVPEELKGSLNVDNKSMNRTLYGITNTNFNFNSRNLDAYTDYYVSNLVSIDKSHGKTSTSYNEKIKEILPTRRRGIFRSTDISQFKSQLDSEGFFDQIKVQFKYLPETAVDEIKTKITKKLMYSRQTPIQEGFRLRRLADAFKDASTLRGEDRFVKKKENGKFVPITIGDVRAMKDSESSRQRNMYSTFEELEGFFFGDEGWISEINRNSSGMNAVKPKSSRISDARHRIREDIYASAEMLGINVSYDVVDGLLFNNRAGFSNDIEIETLYKFMGILVDDKGNPITWTGEASPNNPIRKQGSLFRGTLVDILNYAMIDESVTHFTKESYSTVDMDYAKVSYRMMLEDKNFKNEGFKINTILYDKTMLNLLDFITDEKLFDRNQIESNIYSILNSDTSAEFLENYINSVKQSIDDVSNRGAVFSYIDGLMTSVGNDIDKTTYALNDMLSNMMGYEDAKSIQKRNQTLESENSKLKERLQHLVEEIDKKTSTIDSQNKEIDNLNRISSNEAYNEIKDKMSEMEKNFMDEKKELNETIKDLNRQLESLPRSKEELQRLIEYLNETKKKYDKLLDTNYKLQERYDYIMSNIKDKSMLDEASMAMNAMKSYISTIRESAREDGNAFQSNMNRFFDAFDTVTHNGLEKVIDPYEIFMKPMENSYKYIGVDSSEMMKLCDDLFSFSANAGLFDRSEKNPGVFVVKKSLDSLTIAQLNELTDILSDMKNKAAEAYKEFSERKEKEFKTKRDAIVNEMQKKGSKIGITMNEYFDNIKVGSEEWKKNNLIKVTASVELLAPKLRETSKTLYSFMFGGYINGRYNNINLNTAYNESITQRKSRYSSAFSRIAEIFNRYEGTDKYNEKYVEAHRSSMFGETERIGFISLEEFQKKNGPLSLKSNNEDVYSNYYNSDLKFIADVVTSKYIELEKQKRIYKNAVKRIKNLSEYYGYDIEVALVNDKTQINYEEMSSSDATFVKSYNTITRKAMDSINSIEYMLKGKIGDDATYTKDALMNIFLVARQEGGLDHLLGDMTIDGDGSKINGNGLSLGNILWVMDRFINDASYRKYYETAKVLQEEISSRRMEIEAVKFRTKNRMIGNEENYYTIVSDPDSLMSFYDYGFDADNVFAKDAKVVGDVKSPSSRFTNLRVGGNTPLNLSAMNIFVGQIERQEKYIAFTEILSEISTLINPNSKDNVIGALQYGYSDSKGSAKEGSTIVSQIKDIIDAITVPEKSSDLIKMFLGFSRNATVYKSLGFNIVSTMLQTTAYTFVVDDIGFKNAVRFLWKYMVDSAAFGIMNIGKDGPTVSEENIIKYSPQMATFINTDTLLSPYGLMENMLIKANEKAGDRNRGVKAAETFASIKSIPFIPLDWMNRNIAFATWYAYFNTYLEEHPEMAGDEEYRMSCANEATQKTLDITPNNFEKDKAKIYNNKDSKVKDILMFTSQVNKVFNKLNAKIQGVRFGEGRMSDVLKVVGLIGFVGLMNSAINGYIGGGDDDDDDSEIKRILKGVAGEIAENSIPLIGGEVSDIIKGNEYYENSVFRNFISKLFSEEGLNWTDFMNIVSELGSWFELPTGFFNKVFKAVRDGNPLWLLNYNYANIGR